MKTLIRIKLIPEIDFETNMIVKVMDFPKDESSDASSGAGDESSLGQPRQRCKITVEYAAADIDILKKKGMDKKAALEYYRDWVYNVVRINISQDWQCVGGMDEVLETIEAHISKYFA